MLGVYVGMSVGMYGGMYVLCKCGHMAPYSTQWLTAICCLCSAKSIPGGSLELILCSLISFYEPFFAFW